MFIISSIWKNTVLVLEKKVGVQVLVMTVNKNSFTKIMEVLYHHVIKYNRALKVLVEALKVIYFSNLFKTFFFSSFSIDTPYLSLFLI